MARSWSHTNKAYDSARERLKHKGRDFLEEAYAEWRTALAETPQTPHGHLADDASGEDVLSAIAFNPAFDEETYQEFRQSAGEIPRDRLVRFIWEHMRELRTCDEKSMNAWACPYGDTHMVSFNDPDAMPLLDKYNEDDLQAALDHVIERFRQDGLSTVLEADGFENSVDHLTNIDESAVGVAYQLKRTNGNRYHLGINLLEYEGSPDDTAIRGQVEFSGPNLKPHSPRSDSVLLTPSGGPVDVPTMIESVNDRISDLDETLHQREHSDPSGTRVSP